MKIERLYRSVFFSAALMVVGIEVALADPTGLWRGSDGSVTRISHCGAALCGFLASINPHTDPSTGQPWKDKNNPNSSKRDRPLVGTEVLINMRPDGSGRWSGQLYNYDGGQTVAGHLIEMNENAIRVEGCVLVLCGGENLTRAK